MSGLLASVAVNLFLLAREFRRNGHGKAALTLNSAAGVTAAILIAGIVEKGFTA